jgi:hypothetical protein
MSSQAFPIPVAVERRVAARLYNRVLELLDRDERTIDEDDELVHAAHASRYHWGRVGQPVQVARGEAQCSRAYARLGRAEPALHHAGRYLQLAQEHDLGTFDVGSAHATIAAAAKLAGLDDYVAKHAALALAAAEQLSAPDERQALLEEIAAL